MPFRPAKSGLNQIEQSGFRTRFLDDQRFGRCAMAG